MNSVHARVRSELHTAAALAWLFVSVGASILVFVYLVAPLGYIKSLQRFDQLAEIDHTDTGGLTFDKAKASSPAPHLLMPRAVSCCATLLPRRHSRAPPDAAQNSIGLDGCRPTINSVLFAEAHALAAIRLVKGL